MAGKCKWEIKVINQMGSKGEEGNAAGRICCWVLRGRITEPTFGHGLFSARGLACQDDVPGALTQIQLQSVDVCPNAKPNC